MCTAQAKDLTATPSNISWSGVMTVQNVSQICERLGILLIGKEITITTLNEVREYKPEVFPKQKLYTFDSGHSFEIKCDDRRAELWIAIEPTFVLLRFRAAQLFSDGTFQCPHNPHFEFGENHVRITWFEKISGLCFKNYMVLSV